MNKISEIFKNKETILEFIDYLNQIDLDTFVNKIAKKLTYKEIVKITDLIDPDTVPDILVDTNGFDLQMKRNPTLKYAYKQINYLPIHLLLIERCKKDIIYFCRKYYFINTLDQGVIRFNLRSYQEKMIQMWNGDDVEYELDYYDPDDVSIDSPPKWKKKVSFKGCNVSVTKCGRQQGKSVTAGAFLIHQLTFFSNRRCGIISNKSDSANELLGNAKKSYESMPFWLKQGILQWNVKTIEFENGSRCKAYPLTPTSGTGDTINLLIADEYSKWNPTVVKALNNSLIPTISSGANSKICYISTTYGDNHYKTMWKESLKYILSDGKEGNSILPFEFTYREIPERNNPAWVKKQIGILGGIDNFAQENCGKFLSVSGTLINGYKLSLIQEQVPIEDDYIRASLSEYADYISIYNKPIEDHLYIIVVDPNESNGNNNNNKTKPNAMGIQIIDVTDMSKQWVQVGTGYIDGDSPVHYLELAPISYFLCKYYNDAVLFIENNIAGKEIGNKIYTDYMYEKVYSEKEGIFGYRLKQNKIVMCKMLKFVIEHNLLLLQDSETIRQLKSFIKKGISYEAMLGYEDDLITSLLGAMLLLLLDETTISNYFPETFVCPNKMTILEEVYRLNPTKNNQIDVMFDLVVKIQETVQSDIDKMFDLSTQTITVKYGGNSYNESSESGFF